MPVYLLNADGDEGALVEIERRLKPVIPDLKRVAGIDDIRAPLLKGAGRAIAVLVPPSTEKGKDLAGLIDIVNKRAGPGVALWLKVVPRRMMPKHFLAKSAMLFYICSSRAAEGGRRVPGSVEAVAPAAARGRRVEPRGFACADGRADVVRRSSPRDRGARAAKRVRLANGAAKA